MKKHLLLSALAVATITPLATAQNPATDPNCNPTENLKLEWYHAPQEPLVKNASGAGYVVGTKQTGVTGGDIARTGIGSCGKFFVPVLGHGIYIYGPDGLIETIDNKDTWLSINCDEAGHVYFRHDDGGWWDSRSCYNAGTATESPGALYHQDKTKFSVIDAKTNRVIKSNIPMPGIGNSNRFDELPHLVGNMVEDDYVEMPILVNGKTSGVEIIYDKLVPRDNQATFNIGDVLKNAGFPSSGNNAATVKTNAMIQMINGGQSMAVLANPTYQMTSSTKGWGNNIALFNFDEDEDDFVFSGKWFNTPNHSTCSGFYIFNYEGKNYIIYPTGMMGDEASADGFFVMPEELLDTPRNKTNEEDPADWSVQVHKRIAHKYATDFYGYGGSYRGLNVEPVEGEDGKFRIYLYCPYKVMEVWTLDMTGTSGVEDIIADIEEAKIFGGEGVVVTQSEGPAQVFTLAGQLVAEGKGKIAVPAGVYIVKADNKAAKIIVR